MSAEVPGSWMRREIEEQPVMIARLADRRDLDDVGDSWRRRTPRRVQLLARGTSGHAALYAKTLIETTLNLPVALVSPSSTTLLGASPWGPGDLIISISQSGESPDLIACLRSAVALGADTIALTNSPESTLARVAAQVVDLDAGPELSVAATKSYTGSVMVLARLVAAVAEEEWDFGSLAEAAASALDGPVPGLDLLSGARAVVVLGRAFSTPTAREAALKLMETCALPALSFSSAEFLHGPIAALAPDVPVLWARSGTELPDAVAELLERCAAAGAPVVEAPRADVDPRLSAIVDIIPFQRLALAESLRRGLDPDRPDSLAKATLTL